jgi:hypothetical protein
MRSVVNKDVSPIRKLWVGAQGDRRVPDRIFFFWPPEFLPGLLSPLVGIFADVEDSRTTHQQPKLNEIRGSSRIRAFAAAAVLGEGLAGMPDGVDGLPLRM